MTTLYLLRGLPGSGKSTLATTLLEAGIVSLCVEEDDFWRTAEGVYQFAPEEQRKAANLCYLKAKEHLASGRSVAVANVCGTKQEVQRYKRLSEELGVHFVSLVVEGRHQGWQKHCVARSDTYQMLKTFNVEL